MNHQFTADLQLIQGKLNGLSKVLSLLISSCQNTESEFCSDDYQSILELVSERLVDAADDLSILSESLEEDAL